MKGIIVITGMHRSGTSLIANWLFESGLDLGKRLIGATPSNIYGHFEDVDFVEFHEALLKYNNTNMYQGLGHELSYSDDHMQKAKRLVKERSSRNSFWGWKQPRASLFLDFWLKILPDETYFILPFRDYHDVTNSLFKREYKKIEKKYSGNLIVKKKAEYYKNKKKILNSYLSMWIRHNEEILKLLNYKKHTSLLYFSLNSFIKNNRIIYAYIKNNWQFTNLKDVNFENIYDKNILVNSNSKFQFDIDLKKKADKILCNLLRAEMDSLDTINSIEK